MPFVAPAAEQRFVLDHVAGIGPPAGAPRSVRASEDTIDAILEGIADFAAGERAPLARRGDIDGPKLTAASATAEVLYAVPAEELAG